MALNDLTSREAILAAIAECDRLGQDVFLATHGFRPARSYVLLYEGRTYDSKAIVGVAHGYQHPSMGPLPPHSFSGGDATVRRVLERLGFTVQKRDAVASADARAVANERERRERMWQALTQLGDTTNLLPSAIQGAGIRPMQTGQGIYRDHANTKLVAPPHGVTLTLLDIGQTYLDEFDDAGGIYHYPATERGGDRDEAEIQATKNALRLRLPVFVVLPGQERDRRSVKQAWVVDSDDETRQFLVSFQEADHQRSGVPAADAEIDEGDEAPLELKGGRTIKMATVKARPGQARFRFKTLKRYGAQCAVCSVTAEALLEAVHIVPFAHENSVDDPRNALVLCRNHHRAFDANMIGFEPNTLNVLIAKSAGGSGALQIQQRNLSCLAKRPDLAALPWRWERLSVAERDDLLGTDEGF
jgi:hypothetical protein